METKYKQQCTDVLHNCGVLSKGHLSDKTKTRYPGKGSILPSNWNTQEKMASFGAHKPFSPSATEVASLKVSIKKGFYLQMYCPHSPLYTLKTSMLQTLTVPEPYVALHRSVSIWPSAPHTEITSTPNSSRWEDFHWCQLWKSFRFLANRSCKINEPCAKWCFATTGPFQHRSF